MPEPGTVVQLKSGGLLMTTGQPKNLPAGPGGERRQSKSVVWCYWFDGTEQKKDTFPISVLKEADQPS